MPNGILARIRRNHALEHATINLLSRRHPGAHLLVSRDLVGFTLFSSSSAEEVIPATRDALSALQSGHSALALHENCGTNLVISAALTTLATLLGLRYSPVAPALAAERGVALGAISWSDTSGDPPQCDGVDHGRAPWRGGCRPTSRRMPMWPILRSLSFFTDYHGGMGRIRVHTRRGGRSRAARSCGGDCSWGRGRGVRRGEACSTAPR